MRKVTSEFARVLKKDGIVFLTTTHPDNYHATKMTKEILDGDIHHILFDAPSHRVFGLEEFIYVIKDEDELESIFPCFDTLSIGYCAGKMFDLDFKHWIYVGKKK